MMSGRSTAAALVVLAALASACVGPFAGEPGRSAHDRAVTRLEDAADAGDGWVTVDVPILHEGGGHSTWWLAPCDGDRRPATVTGYSGSDVADVPGNWFVDDDRTVPCHDPAREIAVDGRAFTFDTPVVDLGSGWAPLDGTDRIVATDQTTGARHELGPDTGVVTVDPCDGTTSWTVTWYELVTFAREPCLDTLGALPDVVLDLVPEAGRDLSLSRVDITPEQARAVADAFATLDEWSAAELEAVWQGPCRSLPDGDRARTVVDLHSSTLAIGHQPCA